jgi:hypothetical protein
LLRSESLSGHPEGAKAPEGPPTILGRYLANARQDKEGLKGLRLSLQEMSKNKNKRWRV